MGPMTPRGRDLFPCDDVRGAVRLYGGRVRVGPRRLCPRFAAPEPPAELRVSILVAVGPGRVCFAVSVGDVIGDQAAPATVVADPPDGSNASGQAG